MADEVKRVNGTPAAKKANYVGGRPKDESKLSTDPRQVRIRLRRAARSKRVPDGRIDRDMAILGYKPVEEWDLAELAHGRPRNSKGTFAGTRPMWLTSRVQAEAKKRLGDVARIKVQAFLPHALKTVYELMTSNETDDKGKPIVDARTRLAAAQLVIEHVIGKPQANLNLTATAEENLRTALIPAIVLDDGQPQDEPLVLEGEFTEETEDEDDIGE